MRAPVLGLEELGRADIGVAGGKGANLGELSRLEGIRVPAGFCVATAVFERVVAPRVHELLDRLAGLEAGEAAIAQLAATIRAVIEAIAIPNDVREAIAGFLARLGAHES